MTVILTESEKSAATAEVRSLITASGATAILLRAQTSERLYGNDDAGYVEIGEIAIELTVTPPTDLSKQIDATGCVLPELDVRVEDRVRIGAINYRVQSVVPQSLFGIVTHKVIELVELHGC